MRLSRLWAAAPPLVVGVVGLVLWEGAVAGFGIREFLLPRPSSILTHLLEDWAMISHAGWETGRIAVSGRRALRFVKHYEHQITGSSNRKNPNKR